MSRLVALYPRRWRARYEDEFLAVIASRPLDLRTRADIVLGAIDARMFPQLNGEQVLSDARRAGVLERRLGTASVFGVVPWLLAWLVASMGPIVRDGQGAYRDGALGFPFLILAVLLLLAGIGGHLLRAAGARAPAKAIVVVAIGALLLWSVMPWNLIPCLVGLVSLAAFAVLEWRAGRWPTWAIAPLVAVVVALVALGLIAMATASPDRLATPPAVLAMLALSAAVWLIVGGALIVGSSASSRSDPSAVG